MQNYLFDLLTRHNIEQANWIPLGLIICLIVIITIIIHFILHKILLKSVTHHYAKKGNHQWANILIEHKLFNRIILTLQGFVIYLQAKLWLNNGETDVPTF